MESTKENAPSIQVATDSRVSCVSLSCFDLSAVARLPDLLQIVLQGCAIVVLLLGGLIVQGHWFSKQIEHNTLQTPKLLTETEAHKSM